MVIPIVSARGCHTYGSSSYANIDGLCGILVGCIGYVLFSVKSSVDSDRG